MIFFLILFNFYFINVISVTVGYDFKEPIAFVLDELQFKSKTIVPKSIGIAIAEKNDFINSVGILNEIDFKN